MERKVRVLSFWVQAVERCSALLCYLDPDSFGNQLLNFNETLLATLRSSVGCTSSKAYRDSRQGQGFGEQLCKVFAYHFQYFCVYKLINNRPLKINL
jgi:hypothetical protein